MDPVDCVTVVIPYFQRQAGVLRKALASIAAQRGCRLPVHVIVVDDASPVPAREELSALGPLPGLSLEVIEQANAGPGAARNTGLAAAPDATVYLAFLDSDDEWSADHLARAVTALDAGFDFYFADHFQLGQSVGAFARGGRIQVGEHAALGTGEQGLHEYRGDLFDQILRGNVIGTSTVVYRWKNFADRRFQVEFTTAGEDYLFWMALAKAGARPCFSSQIEATYGKGVNIFAGAVWGTEAHMQRLQQEIRFRRAVQRQFPLNRIQQLHVKGELSRLRLAITRDALHRLRHGRTLPAGILGAMLRSDPLTFLLLPVLVARIALRR